MTDELKFSGEILLVCPQGGNMLHHEGIKWLAAAEDKDGVRVDVVGTVAPEVVTIPWKREHAFGRRGAMVIAFSCEYCGEGIIHHLQIMQHKGSTYMEWLEDVQVEDAPAHAGDEQLPNHM